MPFLLLFNIDLWLEHFLHVVWQFLHGSSARIICGLLADRPQSPRGLSMGTTQIIRDHHTDYLRRTAQLSAAVHPEQPQNSAEKVKFSV